MTRNNNKVRRRDQPRRHRNLPVDRTEGYRNFYLGCGFSDSQVENGLDHLRSAGWLPDKCEQGT